MSHISTEAPPRRDSGHVIRHAGTFVPGCQSDYTVLSTTSNEEILKEAGIVGAIPVLHREMLVSSSPVVV